MNHPGQLFRICDNGASLCQLIVIGKSNVLTGKIHSHFLITVLKKLSHIQRNEIIGDPVRFDLGIDGQLI